MKRRTLNIDQITDLELISAYKRSKDKELVGLLFKRYTPLVYGVCLKYLKERESSKDMTMQVFEKLLLRLEDQDIVNFKSWLHVLTKNECLMLLRKQSSQSERAQIVNGTDFMELSIAAHHEDEGLEEDVEKLGTCIDGLNEEQQECIKLFYLDKKCYQEVCDLTGYEMKKVKSYLQNGRRNLKLCIEKLRGQEEQTY
ncbi:RNA polymerase sigma factor [Roseivirga sp. E12]|uniref:RNA polymerase sigma factor n=1 Tax=Roseivirga sp. E12 TaxID=2819237 RepID=UPI001ABCD857|nr:sigma-70 family RNA polymerase sigma factor [Roseivirga sp. E12]MBO3700547.1 sigma-70 family RNA polymerase sigma factor [Roseivirga sp. E12]